MVALKITGFGGMIPAQGDSLLPEQNAALAQNTFLDAGEVYGIRQTKTLHTMVNSGWKYAFRVPLGPPDKNHITNSYWWEFADPDTNVLKSQLTNDSWQRYYFCSPSQSPGYNTQARITAGNANYLLGIPAPTSAPTVAVAGGSGTTAQRAYVYTWVSAYGEEGPPSPPVSQTGFVNGTWNVTIPAAPGSATTNRNLVSTNIYRTVTNASGGATYYLVAQIPIGTLTYADTLSDVTVAGNVVLPSLTWFPPPTDMIGFVSMPNGMMAGWRLNSNEVWFCEPYRPHAWPAQYTIGVDANVVGLGVVGQTLVILTQGFPYSATGINPSNMALSKIATFEPCMSRGGIVSTATGVFYPSPNGVCLAAYGMVQNATLPLATKDRFQDLLTPESMRSAKLSASYYTFGSSIYGGFEPTAFDNASFSIANTSGSRQGALINLGDPRVAWTELVQSVSVDNVMTDLWSGEIFLMQGGVVGWLDVSSAGITGSYLWRSKQFQMSQKTNLKAMKISFINNINDPSFVHNTTRNTNNPQALGAGQYGLLRVYGDGNLIMTREIWTDNEVMTLPAGYKADFYQFEIEARVRVQSLQVASSIKELAGV
jgi:hypothetical protein